MGSFKVCSFASEWLLMDIGDVLLAVVISNVIEEVIGKG